MRKSEKVQKNIKFNYKKAPDIRNRVLKLVSDLHLDYINTDRLFFYRSEGSKARAYARTWGLPKLWQNSLEIDAAYIIEVISGYFDKLPMREQDKVLLHELSHIPKNFSGALLPHTKRAKGNFRDKLEGMISRYLENSSF